MHADFSSGAVSDSNKEAQNVRGEPGSAEAVAAETWKGSWQIEIFCEFPCSTVSLGLRMFTGTYGSSGVTTSVSFSCHFAFFSFYFHFFVVFFHIINVSIILFHRKTYKKCLKSWPLREIDCTSILRFLNERQDLRSLVVFRRWSLLFKNFSWASSLPLLRRLFLSLICILVERWNIKTLHASW